MGPSWAAMDRLYLQLHLYIGLHKWILILIGIFILGYIFKSYRSISLNIVKRKLVQLFLNIRINALKEPLIKLNFPLVVYAAICFSFVLYMSLGRHTGATLWYFFQLLSPFLLAGAAWVFSRYAYWPILCVPFLIYNLHIMTTDQNYKYFNKNMPGWPEISLLVSQHQHVLNTPLIAPLLIEQNKEVFDNGQSEYFYPGGRRDYWLKGLFKTDDRVSFHMTLFFYNIKDMVENKKFDLIVLQPNLLPCGVADAIRKYYKFEGQFMLYAPQDRRPYPLTIWKPL